MSDKFDLVSVGHAAVDLIISVDLDYLTTKNLAKGATTRLSADDFDALLAELPQPAIIAGGCAVNTAAGVAAFGGAAKLLARIGDDQYGKILTQSVHQAGITFSDCLDQLDRPSLRCLVLTTEDGERSFVVHESFAELEANEFQKSDFAAAKISYFEAYPLDNDGGAQALKHALKLARETETKVAFNLSDPLLVDRHRDFMMDLISARKIDTLIANESEVKSLFNGAPLESCLQKLADLNPEMVFVATRGDQGSVVQKGSFRSFLPAQPIDKIIDSCGAGDHYAAGFLYGQIENLSLIDCGKLGAAAAAQVLQQQGTIPKDSYKWIASKIKRRFPYSKRPRPSSP